MKVKEFKARIKTIEYKEFDARGNRVKDDKVYMAQCVICETHQGRQSYEIRHNCSFYMPKEDYDNQILEVGDIVQIDEGVTFMPTLVNFNVYDEKKLKEMPANKIRTDEKGRPYCPNKAFAYRLCAKLGKWHIDRKASEMYYWQLGRLKIYMSGDENQTGEQEMLNEPSYAFYIDANEYEKVKDFAGKDDVVMNGYKYNSIIKKQPVKVTLTEKPNIAKWVCSIEKLDFEAPSASEF